MYNIAPTPIIEIIEDDSQPIDEGDMTFLNDVLEQYQHNLRHQGLRTRMFNKKCVRMTKHFFLFFIGLKFSIN